MTSELTIDTSDPSTIAADADADAAANTTDATDDGKEKLKVSFSHSGLNYFFLNFFLLPLLPPPRPSTLNPQP